MNTKDLKYFITLVELKNYTQVAQKYSVSQPSVTQAIKRLEKEFDTQLVKQDRSHQKTIITRSGKLLYNNALMMNHYLSLAHQEIKIANSKKIRVGLPPIIGSLYFSQISKKLLETGLLAKTNIIENGSDELLNKLKKGEVDIALLGSVKPIHNNEIDAVNLGSRPFVIIASRENPLSKKDSVSFTELAKENFINLSGRYVHPTALKTYCEYADINPNIVYETSDIAWDKSLVRSNLGISLIVRDAVHRDDNLKVIEVVDPVPVSFNISVAIRKNYVLSEKEANFIKIVQKMKI